MLSKYLNNPVSATEYRATMVQRIEEAVELAKQNIQRAQSPMLIYALRYDKQTIHKVSTHPNYHQDYLITLTILSQVCH